MIYWGYMNISNKYVIKLSAREQRQIKNIMRKGTHQTQVVTRASVLWKSHHGMKDEDIALHTGMSGRNISRVRKRYAIQGMERALYDAARPGHKPVITDDAEAKLVAVACSDPPDGTHQFSSITPPNMHRGSIWQRLNSPFWDDSV